MGTAALSNVRISDIKKLRSTVVAMAKKQSAPTGKKVWGDGIGKEVGVFPPFDGGWDPLGLSANLGPGEIAYFRDAELKHGRVCMLASLGIVVQERFHPLFGGDIDGPALQSLGRPSFHFSGQRSWPQLAGSSSSLDSAEAKR